MVERAAGSRCTCSARPVRIGTDVDRVSLPDVDATGAFRVLGYDHDGFGDRRASHAT